MTDGNMCVRSERRAPGPPVILIDADLAPTRGGVGPSRNAERLGTLTPKAKQSCPISVHPRPMFLPVPHPVVVRSVPGRDLPTPCFLKL
jgi:hypothetical protein